MAHKDYNKKAPQTKVCNQKTKPKYGFVHGVWDECGGHDWVYGRSVSVCPGATVHELPADVCQIGVAIDGHDHAVITDLVDQVPADGELIASLHPGSDTGCYWYRPI